MFPELNITKHKNEASHSEILMSYSELLSLGFGFGFPGFDLLLKLVGRFLLISRETSSDFSQTGPVKSHKFSRIVVG